MKSICVYCGSSLGRNSIYREAAQLLGREIALRGLTLVYGGGNVGLMNTVADAALAAGGSVIGVIPHALRDKELAHAGLSELHIVKDMHERKARMAELADGFIAMPGGFGTLEEIAEVLTWTQLGWHFKPCALLNVNGFYDSLRAFLQHSVNEAFVKQPHVDMILVDDAPARLLDAMQHYVPQHTDKWVRP